MRRLRLVALAVLALVTTSQSALASDGGVALAFLLKWTLGPLLVLIICGYVYGFLKNRFWWIKYDHRSTYPKCFDYRLAERFPRERIYLIPPNYSKSQKQPLLKVAYDDNCAEWWKNIYKAFPTQPHSKKEQDEREALFWKRYAILFTVKDGNSNLLKPDGDIIDHFKLFERWIFREYFAATGTVHKTICEEEVRIDMKFEGAEDEDAKEVTAARQNFARVTNPAHFERWGGWFLFGVREAFEKLYAVREDFGPQTPTSPKEHPAQDDLDYTPNV